MSDVGAVALWGPDEGTPESRRNDVDIEGGLINALGQKRTGGDPSEESVGAPPPPPSPGGEVTFVLADTSFVSSASGENGIETCAPTIRPTKYTVQQRDLHDRWTRDFFEEEVERHVHQSFSELTGGKKRRSMHRRSLKKTASNLSRADLNNSWTSFTAPLESDRSVAGLDAGAERTKSLKSKRRQSKAAAASLSTLDHHDEMQNQLKLFTRGHLEDFPSLPNIITKATVDKNTNTYRIGDKNVELRLKKEVDGSVTCQVRAGGGFQDMGTWLTKNRRVLTEFVNRNEFFRTPAAISHTIDVNEGQVVAVDASDLFGADPPLSDSVTLNIQYMCARCMFVGERSMCDIMSITSELKLNQGNPITIEDQGIYTACKYWVVTTDTIKGHDEKIPQNQSSLDVVVRVTPRIIKGPMPVKEDKDIHFDSAELSCTVYVGKDVELMVEAENDPEDGALLYQWYDGNSNAIVGATSSLLRITEVSTDGRYSCRVTQQTVYVPCPCGLNPCPVALEGQQPLFVMSKVCSVTCLMDQPQAPEIILHPISQIVGKAGHLLLSVTAEINPHRDGDIQFVFFKDDVKLVERGTVNYTPVKGNSGQFNCALEIDKCAETDVGSYHAVVSSLPKPPADPAPLDVQSEIADVWIDPFAPTIIQEPKGASVQRGSEYVLSVVAENLPYRDGNLSVSWIRNGEDVGKLGDNVGMVGVEGAVGRFMSTLSIKDIQEENVAAYWCVVTCHPVEPADTTPLFVESPRVNIWITPEEPVIEEQPQSVVVERGSPVSIRVVAQNVPSIDGEMLFEFMRNGTVVDQEEGVTITSTPILDRAGRVACELTIDKLDRTHIGEYQVAVTAQPPAPAEQGLPLRVLSLMGSIHMQPAPPVITVNPASMEIVEEGSKASLMCTAYNIPEVDGALNFVWKNDGVVIVLDGVPGSGVRGHRSVVNTEVPNFYGRFFSELTIEDMHMDELGMYTCTVESTSLPPSEETLMQVTSDGCNLLMQGKAPNIIIQPEAHSVGRTWTTELVCEAKNVPSRDGPLRFSWFFNNQKVLLDGGKFSEERVADIDGDAGYHKSELVIKQFAQEDIGTYHCVVSAIPPFPVDAVPLVTQSAAVNVWIMPEPPYIELHPTKFQIVPTKSDITLKTVAWNLPAVDGEIEMIWMKDGVALDIPQEEEGGRVSIVPLHTVETTDGSDHTWVCSELLLTAVTQDDVGPAYTCMVLSTPGDHNEGHESYKHESDPGSFAVAAEPPTITHQPKAAQIVARGEKLALSCEAEILPARDGDIMVQWFFGDELQGQVDTTPVNGFPGRHVSTLTIPSFLDEHTGVYHCIYSSLPKESNSTEPLQVRSSDAYVQLPPEAPVILVHPEHNVIKRESLLYLHCQAECVPERDGPLELSWYKDGVEVGGMSIGSYEISTTLVEGKRGTWVSELTVHDAMMEHVGMYQCMVSVNPLPPADSGIMTTASLEALVRFIPEPPRIVDITPLSQVVPENVTAALICTAYNLPLVDGVLNFIWYKNGVEMTLDTDTSHLHTCSMICEEMSDHHNRFTSELTISTMGLDDIASYTCEVQSTAVAPAEEELMTAMSDVGKVFLEPQPPRIIRSPNSQTLARGSTATLVAEAEVVPARDGNILFEWYYKGELIVLNGSSDSYLENDERGLGGKGGEKYVEVHNCDVDDKVGRHRSTLFIADLNLWDVGTLFFYSCRASSLMAEPSGDTKPIPAETEQANIIMLPEAPKIEEQPPTIQLVPTGTDAHIKVVASNIPSVDGEIIFQWCRDEVPIEPQEEGGRVTVMPPVVVDNQPDGWFMSELIISKVMQEDVGAHKYTCAIQCTPNGPAKTPLVVQTTESMFILKPEPPTITRQPIDAQVVRREGKLELSCDAELLPARDGIIAAQWYIDDEKVENSSGGVFPVEGQAGRYTSTLIVQSFTERNIGVYWCVFTSVPTGPGAENGTSPLDTKSISVTANLAPEHPVIIEQPSSGVIERGSHFEVQCVAESMPQRDGPLSFQWSKDGEVMRIDGNSGYVITTVDVDGQPGRQRSEVVVDRAVLQHIGVYSCVVAATPSPPADTTPLFVTSDEACIHFIPFPPVIVEVTPSTQIVPRGSSVVLTCTADNLPEVDGALMFTWCINGVAVVLDEETGRTANVKEESAFHNRRTCQLALSSMGVDDIGTYACIVRSDPIANADPTPMITTTQEVSLYMVAEPPKVYQVSHTRALGSGTEVQPQNTISESQTPDPDAIVQMTSVEDAPSRIVDQHMMVWRNTTVDLICAAECVPIRDGVMEFAWFFNNNDTMQNDEISLDGRHLFAIKEVNGNTGRKVSELIIPDFQVRDCGDYHCHIACFPTHPPDSLPLGTDSPMLTVGILPERPTIMEHPNIEGTVSRGDKVILKTVSRSLPIVDGEVHFEVYRDGVLVQVDGKHMQVSLTAEQGENDPYNIYTFEIIIENLAPEHIGTYTVVATSVWEKPKRGPSVVFDGPFSTSSSATYLGISPLPPVIIETKPAEQIVSIGQKVFLVCTASNTEEIDGTLDFRWNKDGVDVDHLDEGLTVAVTGVEGFPGRLTSVLTIKSMTLNDIAIYTCVVESTAAFPADPVRMITESSVANVMVLAEPPAILAVSESQVVFPNSEVELSCVAENVPRRDGQISFEWFKDDDPVKGEDYKQEQSATGDGDSVEQMCKLTIESFADSKVGKYHCVCTCSPADPAAIGDQELASKSKPVLLKLPPKGAMIVEHPRSAVIPRHSQMRVSCIAECDVARDGPLSFQWLKEGLELKEGEGAYQITATPIEGKPGRQVSEILVERAQLPHAGVFECVVIVSPLLHPEDAEAMSDKSNKAIISFAPDIGFSVYDEEFAYTEKVPHGAPLHPDGSTTFEIQLTKGSPGENLARDPALEDVVLRFAAELRQGYGVNGEGLRVLEVAQAARTAMVEAARVENERHEARRLEEEQAAAADKVEAERVAEQERMAAEQAEAERLESQRAADQRQKKAREAKLQQHQNESDARRAEAQLRIQAQRDQLQAAADKHRKIERRRTELLEKRKALSAVPIPSPKSSPSVEASETSRESERATIERSVRYS